MGTLAAGRRIGERYELRSRLGRGGMGEVWAADDLRLHRPVAVKLIADHVADQPGVRERFDAEARAAARLSDPHVVTVHDVGEEDGTPYLVMECLPGRTLADDLLAGPLPADRVRAIGLDVLAALGAAHAVGMVHRDIKPGNVLFTTSGRVKVGDFGIAKLVGQDLTGTGDVIGTAAYLAPERMEGRPAVAASDLWSVGVVLYEALAGAKPYVADSPLALAYAMRGGAHVPLATRRPDLDPALVEVVERALEVDPTRRHPSAAAFAEALRGGRATEPPPEATVVQPAVARTDVFPVAPLPPPPLPPPPLAPRPPAGPSPLAPTAGRPPRRRLPVAPLLLAVGVGLVVLVGVVLAGQGGGDGREQPPTTSTSTSTSVTGLAGALDLLDESVGQ